MSRAQLLILIVLAAMVMVIASACGSVGGSSPSSPRICDGFSAEVGGCDPDRTSFQAMTCEGLGREAGQQLDERLLALYAGPETVNNESRAVRASHVVGLVLGLANLRMRAIGIIRDCGVDEFMAAAEAEFSDALKQQAGTYLADGPPATYEDWLAEVRSIAQIIDLEEGPSSSSG